MNQQICNISCTLDQQLQVMSDCRQLRWHAHGHGDRDLIVAFAQLYIGTKGIACSFYSLLLMVGVKRQITFCAHIFCQSDSELSHPLHQPCSDVSYIQRPSQINRQHVSNALCILIQKISVEPQILGCNWFWCANVVNEATETKNLAL